MDPRRLLLLSRTRSAHANLIAKIRADVDKFAVARWAALDEYRGPQMEALQNAVIPAVLAAERNVASLTSSYLANMDRIATGRSTPAQPIVLAEVTGAAIRNGVEPSTVYRRPTATVNRHLRDGATLAAAANEGLLRLRSLIATDLQLAKTHTAAKRGTGTWYRRVLNGAKNCARCVIASTQRYHRGNLMPIHPGCDCGIEEEQTADPGQVINPDLLEQTHNAVLDFAGDADRETRFILLDGHQVDLRDGSTSAADYTDLIVIHQHGEYGPTLAWRGDRFTGPADL